MIHEERFHLISNADGLELGAVLVAPEQPRLLLQMAHGMAEHKERYLPLMRFLAEHGVACVMNDHRGHGESIRNPGDLGYFYENGAQALVDDLHQITLWMRDRWPQQPLVLFGHSMGSLAVRACAAQFGNDLDGLIVCGSPGANPAAGFASGLCSVLARLKGSDHAKSRLIDVMVNGPFAARFPGRSVFSWLSVNEDNVRSYESDPLCGFPFTLNGYRALFQLMIAAYSSTPVPPDLPTHFISGADDPCATTPEGFQLAMDSWRKRGCTKVTGKMYQGLRHEILNEGITEIWEDLLKVVEERGTPGGRRPPGPPA